RVLVEEPASGSEAHEGIEEGGLSSEEPAGRAGGGVGGGMGSGGEGEEGVEAFGEDGKEVAHGRVCGVGEDLHKVLLLDGKGLVEGRERVVRSVDSRIQAGEVIEGDSIVEISVSLCLLDDRQRLLVQRLRLLITTGGGVKEGEVSEVS